jgi:NADH-quinone oxidoreductase subunit C
MDETLTDIASRLEGRFDILEITAVRDDQAFLRVPAGRAVEIITHLRDREGFTHLVFLTAVDLIEEEIFRLTYLLHNYARGADLGVEADIDRETASAESIHHLWAQAATYERELAEMFGIDFPDSPRAGEQFILESWRGMPPMRRDFDTKAYAEETYFVRPAPHRGAVAREQAPSDDGNGSGESS